MDRQVGSDVCRQDIVLLPPAFDFVFKAKQLTLEPFCRLAQNKVRFPKEEN